MAYIDLHFHSIYSDGTYTPEELLCYAKKKELTAVSLTNHVLLGIKEKQQNYRY